MIYEPQAGPQMCGNGAKKQLCGQTGDNMPRKHINMARKHIRQSHTALLVKFQIPD